MARCDWCGCYYCEGGYRCRECGGTYCTQRCFMQHAKQVHGWDRVEFDRNDGGCFITTAACVALHKPRDCYELNVLRQFRDDVVRNRPHGDALIEDYYLVSPEIIESIEGEDNATEIFQELMDKYIMPTVQLIESKKNEEAIALYNQMLEFLKIKYLKQE